MKRIKQILKPESNLTCNKNVREYDCYFICKNCCIVDDAMYCQKCFYAGDHTGHDWQCVKNIEGVCDCGDQSALIQGCCKHHISSDNIQWKLLLESYSDAELTEISKIMVDNMNNEIFLNFIAGFRILIEIFFFIYLTKTDIIKIRNFEEAVQIILDNDKDTLMEDILYNEQFVDIVVNSLLIRRIFLYKLYKFIPRLYTRQTFFFQSLHSCQFLQSAYGFQYLQGTTFFQDILNFQTAFFNQPVLAQQYEQLFMGTYNKVPQFQFLVKDNLPYMKALSDFQYKYTTKFITPFIEYPNFEIYLQDLLDQSLTFSSFCTPLYKLTDACGYENYEFSQLEINDTMLIQDKQIILDKYSTILADIIDYYIQNKYLDFDINVFNFYPNHIPQLMFIKLVKLYDLDVYQFFNLIQSKIKTSISKDALVLKLVQQFVRIYWYLTTINWKIFPRNFDDNQQIFDTLVQQVYFIDYYNQMASFTNRIITVIDTNFINLIDKCIPQFDLEANNYFFIVLMMNLLMDKEIPSNNDLVDYFTTQCLTFTEDFSQSITNLQNCYYDKSIQQQMKFLKQNCRQIKSIASDTKYQLEKFEQLQYFSLLDTQTQVLINYSLMMGQTSLLPQFLHIQQYLNDAAVSFVNKNMNLQQFIDSLLLEKNEHQNLFYFLSICILTKIVHGYDNKCENVTAKYSDDHIALFVNNNIKLQKTTTKINIQDRFSKLKSRLEQVESKTLLIDSYKIQPKLNNQNGNQQICCSCHQQIDPNQAVCLYDIYPGALNLFQLDTLRTCKHLHHPSCIDSSYGCAICPKDNQFYLYHVLSQNQDKQFQKDDKLLNNLQSLNIDLQNICEQTIDLISQIIVQPFYEIDQRKLKVYVKEQIYILQQLYYQNIIILKESPVTSVIKGALDFDTYFNSIQRFEKFTLIINLPISTFDIIKLMDAERCGLCKNLLKHAINTLQCLQCGKYYHETCLNNERGCHCNNKSSYIINYSEMAICNSQTLMQFRAPYRSAVGTIASSLEGPEYFLDEELLSHILFLIITGDIYIQENNQLIIRDVGDDDSEFYDEDLSEEDFML